MILLTTATHPFRLDRQTSIRSVPAERHSPWIGPLASQDTSPVYTPSLYMYPTPTITPDDSDSDSDASDGEHDGARQHWKNVPVIPMKPLMEAMGLIPSNYHAQGGATPVIPGGLAHFQAVHSAAGGGSPTPSGGGSPYLYSSPRMDSAAQLQSHGSVHGSPSPYVPAWISGLQTTGSVASRPGSRPASRAAFVPSAAGSAYGSPYASPYMQSHTGPF